MDVFVRSCGVSPEHGYCWVRVADTGQTQSEPVLLRRLKIYDLIEHEAFSVGLECANECLCLLITGLQANQGGDYQHRRIVSSLACIGTAADTRLLRGIAATALRGGLDHLADTFITLDADPDGTGFCVAPALLRHLGQQLARDTQQPPQLDHCIGSYNAHLKGLLAKELDERQLPLSAGVLVVVTKHIDPQRLKLARAWRSLSSLFFGDETHWYPLQEVKLNLQGKDLREVDLRGLDLTDANLSGTNLTGLYLGRLDLRGANLSGANLSGANLSGANLRGARLWNADLSAANVSGADLRDTFLLWTKLKDVVHDERTMWPLFFRSIPKSLRS